MKTLSILFRFLLIQSVRFYQRGISPLLGARCKYYPSCSNYFIGAIEKHGVFFGTIRGIWRILRCNPWSKGGVDMP